MQDKPTPIDIKEYEAKIFRQFILGAGVDDIHRLAEKEKWELDAKHRKRAIDRAIGKLAAAAELNVEAETGLAFLQLKDLYALSRKVQDAKTALAVLRERVKALEKLSKPKGNTTAKSTGLRLVQ